MASAGRGEAHMHTMINMWALLTSGAVGRCGAVASWTAAATDTQMSRGGRSLLQTREVTQVHIVDWTGFPRQNWYSPWCPVGPSVDTDTERFTDCNLEVSLSEVLLSSKPATLYIRVTADTHSETLSGTYALQPGAVRQLASNFDNALVRSSHHMYMHERCVRTFLQLPVRSLRPSCRAHSRPGGSRASVMYNVSPPLD